MHNMSVPYVTIYFTIIFGMISRVLTLFKGIFNNECTAGLCLVMNLTCKH